MERRTRRLSHPATTLEPRRAFLVFGILGLLVAAVSLAYIYQSDARNGSGSLINRFNPSPDVPFTPIAESRSGEIHWRLSGFRVGREYCARMQSFLDRETSVNQHCSTRNVPETAASKWHIAKGQAVVLYGVASENVDLIRVHFGGGSVSEVAALRHQELPVRFFVIEISEGDFLNQVSSVDAQGKVLKDQIPLPHLPRDADNRPSASPSAV